MLFFTSTPPLLPFHFLHPSPLPSPLSSLARAELMLIPSLLSHRSATPVRSFFTSPSFRATILNSFFFTPSSAPHHLPSSSTATQEQQHTTTTDNNDYFAQPPLNAHRKLILKKFPHLPHYLQPTTTPTIATIMASAKVKEEVEQRNIALAAKCRAEHTFPAEKLTSFDFYKSIGSPKYVVAPMVDQSELAWRILSRRYNADLCYTPMFNAKLFAKEEKYRDEHWAGLKSGLGGGGPNDRPLIVQVHIITHIRTSLLCTFLIMYSKMTHYPLNYFCAVSSAPTTQSTCCRQH